MTRKERLMPNDVPRWIRCYDNGGRTADRYTIVFTHLGHTHRGWVPVLGMSDDPYFPLGVCLSSEYNRPIDRPRYSHLGKRIKFADLPTDCCRAILNDYRLLWNLPTKLAART